MAISVLAPPRCGVCGGPCGVTQPACDGCVAALARAPAMGQLLPDLDEVWSALAYERQARALITALKFRRLVPLARVAAEVIAAKAPRHVLGRAQCFGPAATLDAAEPERAQRSGSVATVEVAIVPVPPSPGRLRSRGLDPAEEIAGAVAGLVGRPLNRCLERDQAVRQVGRARNERLQDPPRFFAVAEPPASALLVDDVITTGATLGACARALRQAGSSRVAGVTFASAERRLKRRLNAAERRGA